MQLAGPLVTLLGSAQWKRASSRGEAGTSGFLSDSDSDCTVPEVLGTHSLGCPKNDLSYCILSEKDAWHYHCDIRVRPLPTANTISSLHKPPAPSGWGCAHPHLQELCPPGGLGEAGRLHAPQLPDSAASWRGIPLLPPPWHSFCTHSAIYSLWQHSNHKAASAF